MKALRAELFYRVVAPQKKRKYKLVPLTRQVHQPVFAKRAGIGA